MRELGEFVNIGVNAAHESTQLSKDFINVRGNFGQRARKDAEVVVAIHFQFSEIAEGIMAVAAGSGDDRRKTVRATVHCAAGGGTDPVEFILVLKAGDFLRETALREV